jgi:hypothetical protein
MKKILLFLTLMMYSLGYSQGPANGPTTPIARNSWDVKSIYSGAYANQAGAFFDLFDTAGWGGSTLQEVTLGDGNLVQKITNHWYSGIKLNSAGSLDVSGMTKLHFDVWSPNFTGMAVKLEAANGSYRELGVSGTFTQGQWVSFDLNLSAYTTGVDLANLKYIVPVTWGQNATLYFDNVYFYRPATSIPTPSIGFLIPSQTIGASPFSLNPTSDSSGAFSFTSSNTNVATISGSTVTIVGLGTSTITANQAADGTYSGGSVAASLVVTPAEAPTPPVRNPANVLSLFSGAYTNIDGIAWNPNWGQSGSLTEISINGNSTKVLNNLNYQGTDFGAGGINVASMTTLHIDIFTLNCNQFSLYLIGGGENAVTLTPNHTGWNSYDIAMSNYAARTLSSISQLKYEGSPAGSTVYFDNFYFYIDNSLPALGAFTVATKNEGDADFNLTAPTSNSAGAFTYTSSNSAVATINGVTVHITGPGTTTITAIQAAYGSFSSTSITANFIVLGPQAPTVAAPTPPTRNTGDVKSLFSDAYTNQSGTDWYPNWGQSTQITDLNIAGNPTKNYFNLNYQGVNFASAVNASSMTNLHFDIWTPNCTSFDVYPIVPGQPEQKVTLTPTAYGWNSFDIDLTQYTIPLTNIQQMKFVGSPSGSSIVFLDNIYFWKPNTTPTITGFNVPSKLVGSAPFTLTAPSSTSSGTFSYLSSNTNVATISGSIVTIVGAGSTTITATQAASAPFVSGFTSATFFVNFPGPGAPANAPTVDAASVMSIFSDSYANRPGTDFYPNWGQITQRTNVTLQSNAILKYSTMNYQGIQLVTEPTSLNVSAMTHLHLDIWTPNCTSFKVSLVNQAIAEQAVTIVPTLSGWNSIDIPLSQYNLVALNNIGQFKLEATPYGTSEIYLDNLYFAVLTSKVRDSQCGSTLASISTQIAANVITGAQMYRFQVTNGGNVRTFETTKYSFDLTKIAGSTYGTTYSVKVAVKLNNVWGAYGSACNITTPTIFSSASVPLTSMRASQCGTTLTGIGSPIHSQLVYGAEAYRFEITQGGTVTTVESAIYYFFLTDTAIGTYSTTYSIKTAAKVAGFWGLYGTSCSISTPALSASTIPMTQVRPSFCGATLAALNTKIPASLVYGAGGYRFEITTGGVITQYDSPIYLIMLSDAGVVVADGMTYAIRVAANVGGVYGNYGASCNIMTPAGSDSSRQMAEDQLGATSDFKLTAYPNPSNSAFNIQIANANNTAVSVLVFDMMGRQVENKVINATELENVSLGQNYSTGIYNVIVSQGNTTKTVRLVKK